MDSNSELDPYSSCVAPIDFDICSSFDEDNADGIISVAIENCQLCGSARNPFFCVNCVTKGHFTRRNETNKYKDKRDLLKLLRKQRADLLSRFEVISQKQCSVEDKTAERDLVSQRVQLLKVAVDEASVKHNSELDKLKSTRKLNESLHSRLEHLSNRHRRIVEHIKKLRNNIDNQSGELAICEDQLCNLRQLHIRQLVEHIFPIKQIQARSDTDSDDFVNELAEARHTAYVRGRWVYTDNGSEHKYSIVHPTMPGNGDYSAYVHWLADSKMATPGTAPILGEEQPAYAIAAALTFTSQFVALLSYFLDINLPEKNMYSDFCRHSLTERRFNRLVYRLNHNVLQLCFSQNVPMELLHPRHTLHNLLMLMKTPQQGRCQPFDINCDMILSLEAPGTCGEMATEEENSDDENLALWDEAQPVNELEWENVPYFLPEAEVPSSSQHTDCDQYTSTTVVPSPTHRNQGSTSVMGNLVSSAAASVTSLWRAAPWKS